MAFTANLWVLMGITLLVGFLFGLFVSNAGKYKKRWRLERRERERVEQERDALVKEHERIVQERDARVVAAEDRVATLERSPLPLTHGIPAGNAAERGRDRLSAITGIDPPDEVRLNEAGYYRYDQIAGMSAEEERTLETQLQRERGAIRNEQWREQAKQLATGRAA